MIGNRTAWWALAALLGIAVTATLAWTASQIAGQRIGLSSEPLSVSSGLAPAAPAGVGVWRSTSVRHGDPRKTTQTVRTVTATSTAAIAQTITTSAPAPTVTRSVPAPSPPAPPSVSRAQPSKSSGGHDESAGAGSSSAAGGGSSSGVGGGSYSGAGGGSSSGGGHRDD